MSSQTISIVVVETHLLLRECLVSLMSQHPFDTVRGVSSADDLAKLSAPPDNQPAIIILGITLDTEHAILEARRVRDVLSSTKIIYLCERLSTLDVQNLLCSGIDACISLIASRETLVKAIDLVATHDAPSMILIAPVEDRGAPNEEQVSLAPIYIGAGHYRDIQVQQQKLVTLPDAPLNAASSDCEHPPHLSEREWQILHSLTLGQANKVIARRYNITEATVKLHMTSILRKIHAENRTQAALWAMGNGRIFAKDIYGPENCTWSVAERDE
jgi:two-component system nitrate/nitrite response regulator NarL